MNDARVQELSNWARHHVASHCSCSVAFAHTRYSIPHNAQCFVCTVTQSKRDVLLLALSEYGTDGTVSMFSQLLSHDQHFYKFVLRHGPACRQFSNRHTLDSRYQYMELFTQTFHHRLDIMCQPCAAFVQRMFDIERMRARLQHMQLPGATRNYVYSHDTLQQQTT